jgi:hypothetical protein
MALIRARAMALTSEADIMGAGKKSFNQGEVNIWSSVT